MEPVKIFAGNGIEAGAVQQLLNENNIGTWIKNSDPDPLPVQGFMGASVVIYIEAAQEEKAKSILLFNAVKD